MEDGGKCWTPPACNFPGEHLTSLLRNSVKPIAYSKQLRETYVLLIVRNCVKPIAYSKELGETYCFSKK